MHGSTPQLSLRISVDVSELANDTGLKHTETDEQHLL